MESGLDPGKPWKINQKVAIFLTGLHQNPSGGRTLPLGALALSQTPSHA